MPNPLMPSTRSSRAKRAGVLLVVGLLLAVVLAACVPTPEEQQSIDLLNAGRAFVGVPRLAVDDSLQTKAHDQAQRMADAQRLFHSSLASGVRAGWVSLGENVGVGPSPEAVNMQFNRSPDHLSRRTSTAWNAVGIGVVRDAAGRYWVVEEFGRF